MQIFYFILDILIVNAFVVLSQFTSSNAYNSNENSFVLNNSAQIEISNNSNDNNYNEDTENSNEAYSSREVTTTSTTYTITTSSTVSTTSTSTNTNASISTDNSNTTPTVSSNALPSNSSLEIQSDNRNEFVKFLDSINFKFTKPEPYETIYFNTYLNVQWDCNYIDENTIRNISVYYGVRGEGDIIRSYINLNDKGGNFPIGELKNDISEYALWLFTQDYGEPLFYQGPILINGNCTTNNGLSSVSVTSADDAISDTNQTQGIKTSHIIFIIFLFALVFVILYLVVLLIKKSNKNKKYKNEAIKEYKEYKGYTNIPPSVNKLLGIDEAIYNEEQAKQRHKEIQKQTLNSGSNSTQSINSLAEQLYKAEQVYNNKVFKNPNLNDGNEHCAPLVDMSSLYKSTQEILNRSNFGSKYKGNDYMPINNSYYDRKIVDQYPNNLNNNYGDSNKNEEESFLVLDDIDHSPKSKDKNKYNSFGRSDSVNSTKILAQSTSFSMTVDSSNEDQEPNKSFNVLEEMKNNSPNEDKKSSDEKNLDDEEDYLNKNSFCLNSKDSIDVFENIYLNQQNDHSSDNIVARRASPLVATVTTVEEYLAAHRDSFTKEVRLSRSSSLLNSSFTNSTNSLVVGPSSNALSKLNKSDQKLGHVVSSDGTVSPHIKETDGNKAKKLDPANRVSGSEYNSSSAYIDSSMNDSIQEELNSLEKQIQQQRQQMLQTLSLPATTLQSDIDPNQLNLQMANLHQQGIEPDQYFPSFSSKLDGSKYVVPLSTETFHPAPLSHASPPIKPKTLAMTSPSFQSSSQTKISLPSQIKTPSPTQSILKNRTSPQSPNGPTKSSFNKITKIVNKNGQEIFNENIKSQESEVTLQAQQGTQDTVSVDDNDDEVETIVATHVCNAWYSPHMPDELRMCPGDELIILEKFNDGWGFGQNTKGSIGVFPLDCVSYIDYNKINPPTMENPNQPHYSQTTTTTTAYHYSVPNKVNTVAIHEPYQDHDTNIYNINDTIKPSQAVIFDTNDIYNEEDQGYNKKSKESNYNIQDYPLYQDDYYQNRQSPASSTTFKNNNDQRGKRNNYNNIPLHYY